MAIRLRMPPHGLVALCAAKSDTQPNDIYLDDAAHTALANKFARDYNEMLDSNLPTDEILHEFVELHEYKDNSIP